ncbi:MAG: hypothetical protein IIB62_12175, partial [Proteobacteria bacterium]|nr:hypothetical protein [Pseudomonadota bacterium]
DRAFGADELASIARDAGLETHPALNLTHALEASRTRTDGPVRILICGSLYLSGQILGALEKDNNGQ